MDQINQNHSLGWAITIKETRNRKKMFFLIFWIPFVFYASQVLYYVNSQGIAIAKDESTYFFLVVFAIPPLLMIINQFWKYQDRNYLLDDSGLLISKGRKQKKYKWDEFEFYYIENEESPRFKNIEKNIVGYMFYLKKKSNALVRKFYKKYVIVYSEPDNTDKVTAFLSTHIGKKRKKTLRDDLGMMVYEFK